MTNQDRIIRYLEEYAKKRPIIFVAGDYVNNDLNGFGFEKIEDNWVYVGIPINGKVLVCWGRDNVDYFVHGSKTVILPDCQKPIDEFKRAIVSYCSRNGKEIPYSVTPIKMGDTLCIF